MQSAQRGKKIVIVERDARAARLVSSIAREYGLRPERVATAARAAAKASDRSVLILTVNFDLPGVSPRELLAAIRKRNRRVNVVLYRLVRGRMRGWRGAAPDDRLYYVSRLGTAVKMSSPIELSLRKPNPPSDGGGKHFIAAENSVIIVSERSENQETRRKDHQQDSRGRGHRTPAVRRQGACRKLD
ncbi:MAG: hypothetical protein AB1742_02960 [bacterium]